MENDESVNCKYVDIACKGFQDKQDVLYVQCHQVHKETLTAWIKKFIINLNLPANNTNPQVDDGPQTQDNRKNN